MVELSLTITKTITGIIANDYWKIHGDVSNEEKLGPNPKGVAGPQSHAGDEEEHGPQSEGVGRSLPEKEGDGDSDDAWFTAARNGGEDEGKWWRTSWPKEGASRLRLLPLLSGNKEEEERKKKNEWREREGVFIGKGAIMASLTLGMPSETCSPHSNAAHKSKMAFRPKLA